VVSRGVSGTDLWGTDEGDKGTGYLFQANLVGGQEAGAYSNAPSSSQSKHYIDIRLYLDPLPIQQIRRVDPLPHRIQSSLLQHRRTAEHLGGRANAAMDKYYLPPE
jgi:hypothetical protein